MIKAYGKQAIVLAMLVALLFVLAGCLIQPDTTDEDTPTGPVEVLPFQTVTPSPSPDPAATGGQSGWESWSATSSAAVVTRAPTATPTIALITASPTARPVVTVTASPRPTATDDGTLRNGSTGQNVRMLQTALKNLGYYTGSIDGDFGVGTETAVRAFQSQHGLTVDGVAGTRTLEKLYSDSAKTAPPQLPITTSFVYATSRPTPLTYTPSTLSTYRYLQLGSTGADVTRLQNRLKELQYYGANATGSFDANTEAAVTAFQRRNGLWVDGVAGEDTQRMLYSSAALSYTGASTVQQPTGYQTLKNGSEGAAVTQLQSRLSDLYYYNGAIDGKFGATTELAVRVFQQRSGLTVDGVAGSGTQARLYSPDAVAAPTVPPVTAPASGTLQTGSTGEGVYALQERLYDLGFYTGRIDGVYDDEVAAAVRAFQTFKGLKVDGKAGTQTQQALFSQATTGAGDLYSTLREGDSGERVKALQSLLYAYGYYLGTIDGNYGAGTAMSVQQFQSVNGLTPDGVAGPATLQTLYGTPIANPEQSGAGGSATFTSLRQGMSGEDVMMLQQYLRDSGDYAGAVDGMFDAETTVALMAFQSRNGLTADGIAGHQTLALLFSGEGVPVQNAPQSTTQRTKLQSGDEGADVYELQLRLQVLGYLTGVADGKYGAGTLAAVTAFQRANGLTADGVAGQRTLSQLYAPNVVAAGAAAQVNFTAVNNNTRAIEEQNVTGAIQASLSGGGVAASYNGVVYTAGGAAGSLYAGNSELYAGPASFIHASSAGVTFVSGSRILRIPPTGGEPTVLAEAGGIGKLSVVGNDMYYLEGGSLVRMNANGATLLASSINDFVVDVYDYVAYLASNTGIKTVGLNGASGLSIVSGKAEQVALCDSVVFFRSDGALYRVQNGVSAKLLDAEATWFGVYRDHIYYISGERLYRCDTTGQNATLFYDGQTGSVSFVAGRVYITRYAGGAVVEILNA